LIWQKNKNTFYGRLTRHWSCFLGYNYINHMSKCQLVCAIEGSKLTISLWFSLFIIWTCNINSFIWFQKWILESYTSCHFNIKLLWNSWRECYKALCGSKVSHIFTFTHSTHTYMYFKLFISTRVRYLTLFLDTVYIGIVFYESIP